MKKNRRITAILITCLLLFTVPLHAAAPEGVPDDVGEWAVQDESLPEDAAHEGEMPEDAATSDPEEGEGTYTLSGQDGGTDETLLPDQDGADSIQEPAPAEDVSLPGDAVSIPEDTDTGTMPDDGQEAAGPEQEDAGAEPETSGACGEELFWEYSEGILSITGSGEMYDYSYA